MDSSRAAQYRKLLRWYPSAWRDRNGEAIIGVLMDEDDAEGQLSPTALNRIALTRAGLHERFIARERLGYVSFGSLVLALLFSSFYLSVMAWAPGIAHAGTLGPFSNPSVIASGIFVVALIFALFALFARGRTARLVTHLGVVAAILIGVLSSLFSWLGPGIPTVIIFAGLRLIAASPLRSILDAAKLICALLLVVLGVLLTEFFLARNLGFAMDPIGIAEAAGAAAAFLGAFALVWPTARSLRRTVPVS